MRLANDCVLLICQVKKISLSSQLNCPQLFPGKKTSCFQFPVYRTSLLYFLLHFVLYCAIRRRDIRALCAAGHLRVQTG